MQQGRPLYFCPVVSSSFFFYLFLLTYSQPSQIGCLRYFHTLSGLTANLGFRSEMCSTRLAEIQDAKKSPKNPYLCTIAQFCRPVSLQLRRVSTIGKKLVKQQYLFHTCPYNMVKLGPLTAEIGLLVWGTPANLNGFCALSSAHHRTTSSGCIFAIKACIDNQKN